MRIFYDIDTQNDFMNQDGALYVPGAEKIKGNLRKLTRHAVEEGIPIVGSVDRHFGTQAYKKREGELQINGGPFPDHCITGTRGSEKICETSFAQIYIEHNLNEKIDRERLARVLSEISNGRNTQNNKIGLFFEKQSYDAFTNPAVEVFLEMAGVSEAVVYGVATDFCVRAAVLGMQKRGVQTYVVEDAIKGLTFEGERKALEEMAAVGARIVTTEDVLEEIV
jgi:nicotinamidase/pyrazinamidase